MADAEFKLTEEQVASYERDGFLIVRNLLSRAEVDELLVEQLRICRGEAGAIEGTDKEAASLSDEEILRKYIAIHFPHKISESVRKLIAQPKTVQTLCGLVGDDVKCIQTMMFMKGPGAKGQAWHQDEYYIPTRDASLTATWIALDKVDVANGCLWVIPGSHKPKVIYPTQLPDTERFDGTPEAHGYPFDAQKAVPVELEVGDGVFFNGYLLHRSLNNTTSDRMRRAFANHYMNAASMLPWNWDGRLGPAGTLPLDVRDFVMVAGRDWYDHKPMQEVFYPFVRGSKHAEQTQSAMVK